MLNVHTPTALHIFSLKQTLSGTETMVRNSMAESQHPGICQFVVSQLDQLGTLSGFRANLIPLKLFHMKLPATHQIMRPVRPTHPAGLLQHLVCWTPLGIATGNHALVGHRGPNYINEPKFQTATAEAGSPAFSFADFLIHYPRITALVYMSLNKREGFGVQQRNLGPSLVSANNKDAAPVFAYVDSLL
jgi:hypothetical protein